jgi:spermidine synthase
VVVGVALVGAGVATVVFRPTWDPLLMSAGMYKYASDLEEFSREGVRNYAISDYEPLYYKEGVTTTVTVARSLGDGNIWLANNGKIDASTTDDLPTQVLLGHFGFLFSQDPQRVLMVGHASGISTGSASLYGVQVDVLEIEPAVVEASHFFDFINNRPLDRDNVTMVVNDARNHLYLAEQPYDIVINQPSNPWISGVSNLYTLEYFELCREHMTEDGILVQWMQLYGMGQDDLLCILRTLLAVFPEVVLMSSIEEADIVMVASAQPLAFDLDHIEGMLSNPETGADLDRIGIHTAEDLLTYYLMDQVDIAGIAGTGPLNTDDNMIIEFSAPRYLHFSTAAENFQLLLDGMSGPWRKTEPLFDDDADKAAFYDRLGQAYFRRRQVDRALLAYLRAVKLAPNEPRYRDTALLVDEALREGHWSIE